ncbi:hypothetical protein [Blastochloris tepida]|uniref:hypothetical protein n=1 Tax=Blastochloris tepida TaxID=2233851 RepID=UPI000F81BCF9|nr:hypothetical protein [Blastochloris tepida]
MARPSDGETRAGAGVSYTSRHQNRGEIARGCRAGKVDDARSKPYAILAGLAAEQPESTMPRFENLKKIERDGGHDRLASYAFIRTIFHSHSHLGLRPRAVGFTVTAGQKASAKLALADRPVGRVRPWSTRRCGRCIAPMRRPPTRRPIQRRTAARTSTFMTSAFMTSAGMEPRPAAVIDPAAAAI